MKVSKLKQLRKKLLLNGTILFVGILIFIPALVIIRLLAGLDKKYHISEKLAISFENNFDDHKIIFPSTSRTLFANCLMYIALAVTLAFFCKYYFCKRDKEKHKNNPRNTKMRSLPLVRLALFSVITELCNSLSDEFTFSLANSLENSEPKQKYFWMVFLLILISMTIVNFINIHYNYLMNEIRPIEIKSNTVKIKFSAKIKKELLVAWHALRSFDRVKELIVLVSTALIIAIASYGICQLPKAVQFEWSPIIDGQKIQIINNQNNMFFLTFLPIMLFALAYNFVIPAIEKRLEINKVELFKKVGISIMLSIGAGIATVMSNCAIDTIQSIDLNSPAVLIPFLILGISATFFAFFTVKQFEHENEEEKVELGKSGREKRANSFILNSDSPASTILRKRTNSLPSSFQVAI